MRLHNMLRTLGVDSRVLVRTRSSSDQNVFATGSRLHAAWRTRLDGLPLRLYTRREVFAWWSVNWLRSGPVFSLGDWEPDIIHAHWVGDGFVPIEWFNKTGKPVVWTMHDMWPFTGGCHYAADCVRYRGTCGLCPQLGSRRLRDLSFRSVQRKHRAWALFPGALVSPSRWLAEAARESSTFRNNTVQVIPNGLDGSLFSPGDRSEARRQLGIPENERIVLAGAMGAVKDQRKGFSLLAEALRKCSPSDRIAPWRLLVFGADAGPGEDVLGIPVAYRGHIRSEQDLPAFYRAADVYALPSLQDNLPNTVVEALACGTPVVGFRASGLGTMIDDGQTGWLAEPFSTGSLASALKKVLSTSESLRHTCRAQFEREYAWPGPAHQYMALYNALLSRQLGVPITKHSSSQAGD